MTRPLRAAALLAALVIAAAARAEAPATPLRFVLTYDETITDAYTGWVYVMTGAPGAPREPRLGPDWFRPRPFYSLHVTGWRPDEPLVVDDAARGFPGPLSEIPAGEHAVQAVLRLDPDSYSIGRGAGSWCSAPRPVKIDPADGGAIGLRIDRPIEPRERPAGEGVELVELRSDLLSDFHGREVAHRAAVCLPEGYEDQPDREYPALYLVGGFGSDHRFVEQLAHFGLLEPTADVVRIGLDATCRTGHHVFADSATNGPVGTALVEELLPHLESRFRLRAAPSGRFLTGPSSGGWSSLWVQVTHPDVFGGTWSFCPDPVDFRDFQRVNLYEPGANLFRDESGARRPIARHGGEVILWYDDFARMDWVIAEGGQLGSFDAVFSPRGPDGRPLEMFDRATGAVDAEVAEAWRAYDIRHVLESRWDELGPRLEGKITVFMGELDNFYLEGATRRLGEALAALGSDAAIELHPGRDHQSILSPELIERMHRELLERFEAGTVEAAATRPAPAR